MRRCDSAAAASAAAAFRGVSTNVVASIVVAAGAASLGAAAELVESVAMSDADDKVTGSTGTDAGTYSPR